MWYLLFFLMSTSLCASDVPEPAKLTPSQQLTREREMPVSVEAEPKRDAAEPNPHKTFAQMMAAHTFKCIIL